MTEIAKQHSIDLKNIQEQMKSFFARKQKVKIYHGSTNSTRAQKFEKDKFVDVSRLDRVIEINTNEQYILVEPNVPMDKLVEATLKYGLVAPVIPEYPGITVGGGIQGGAGESSSFKYGGVHDCCLEYEIVLGNGEVITASPTKNQDLFYGTACSYGSLGVITLIKLMLIPAKNYVHLTYNVTGSLGEMAELVQRKSSNNVDFVDGIIFEKNRGVVMTGNFSDEKALPISTFTKRSDEWFYLHVDNISQKHKIFEEIIPIKDYLFRYDRGAFWGGRDVCSFLKIPFTKFTRWVLNDIFKTRSVYRLLHATNISQRYLIQDLVLPKENLSNFLEFVDSRLNKYPLWICPLLPAKHDKLSPNYISTSLAVNVGIYKEFGHDYSQFLRANRDIEEKVRELRGRKVLYAHAYYSRDEFWEIYDHTWYNTLRDKYFAGSVFPDVYEKTKVSEKYKSSILLGIWNAVRFRKLPVS